MDGSPGYGQAASEQGTPGTAQHLLLWQPVQLKAKASRFKKNQNTLLQDFVSSTAHTAQLGNGSTFLLNGISTFSMLNCCVTAALVAAEH